MKYDEDFYQLSPRVVWENDTEEQRAKALSRPTEMLIKQRLVDLQAAIVELSVIPPGELGGEHVVNLHILQGKLLALKELLDDSQTAHGVLHEPNS